MLTATEIEALTQAGHDVSDLPEEIARQLFWEIFAYGTYGEQVNAISVAMRTMLEAKIEAQGMPLYFVPTDIPAVAAIINLGKHPQASRYRCDRELISDDESHTAVRQQWNNTLRVAIDFEKLFKTYHSTEETDTVIVFIRGFSIILWETAGLGKYATASPAIQRACNTALAKIPVEVSHA